MDTEHGGAGRPHSLQVLVEEMLTGANTAFTMYPGLAHGAAEVIERFGTDEQKQLYCTRMSTGTWGGTMCLTEPHAGCDVGVRAHHARRRTPTAATPSRGTKIFISGGDHDIAENIIHLVLARVEGAPAGTKGLTLFIVPKVRVRARRYARRGERRRVGAIEHKMGINGTSTCVLNFGENGKCIGGPSAATRS